MRRYAPYPDALAPRPELSARGLAGLALLVAAVPLLEWGLAEPLGPAALGAVAGLGVVTLVPRVHR